MSRQMREPQQFMTVAARNLVDNMGLAAIPMIAIRRDGIEPENKQWEIKKGKVWWLTDEMVKNIGESIQFLVAPTMQNELVANMQLATKMAEDATGINFISRYFIEINLNSIDISNFISGATSFPIVDIII